jgi:hydroxypyruvate reductase
MEARELLRSLFDAAVAAAQPDACVPPHLPPPPAGRTIVLGAGKASAAMARAVEAAWPGRLDGLVVTRYGHGEPCARIEVVEAAHPVPDAAGEAAARRILALAEGATADDLVLFLASGGGSALLTLPAPGLTLDDKRAVNALLLACGATISEINCVRKHLSAIKGGRLAAAAHPAPVVALAISDVPGDDPAVIASGPTVPDPTTFDDALALLDRYRIDGPPAVVEHLRAAGEETPKAGDPRLGGAQVHIVARPAAALDAAAEVARAAGYRVRVLGDAIEGEARDVARRQAERARSLAPGSVLLSGGEVTVTLTGGGRGGPNAEFALALAAELDGAADIWAMACDTDGIDGSEDNAGAVVAPDTLARARARGLDAAAVLADNDSYAFFAALDDLVVTGPTRTNVNDFRAIVVAPT